MVKRRRSGVRGPRTTRRKKSNSRARKRGQASLPAIRTTPKRITALRLERALRVFSDTKNVGAAARSIRVSKKRFLQAAKQYSAIRKEKNGWKIAARVKRTMPIFSNGRHLAITVNAKTAVYVAEYNSAVGQFLSTNIPDGLAKFAGRSVKDVAGKAHPFETDPNALYRLSTASEPFESIYRIVV